MNRSTCASRLGATIALLCTFIVATSAQSASLISCTPSGATTDPITRAFYIPNYPGVDLKNLTMSFASDTSGRFVLTLTAHLDTFDGPVLGSAVNTVDLIGSAPLLDNLTFVFADLTPLPVPQGHTIAFVVNRQGTGPEILSFATGPTGACAAVETNDSTPPLSAVRGSVPMMVTGDAASGGLVTNATFDTGVAGWAVNPNGYPGTLAFSSVDADGSATSGSALVTNTSSASSSGMYVQDCAQNTGAGTYTYGGKIRALPGQSAPGAALFVLGAYSTTDCSGLGLLVFDQTQAPTADGAWHQVSSTYSLPTGRGLKSVALLLTIQKDSASGTYQANFDDVFLQSASIATLTIPGTASIHGQAGSFFHTDLWVLNRSYANAITVTAQFRCFVGLSCGLGSATVTLQPREQALYQDVLASLLFASSTAGTLELTWDSSFGPISASARTYSPSLPAPTTGTGVPALASTASRALAVFTGLASNGGDLSAGFRSNVGVYNPSAIPTTVTFTLFDATGLLLGSTSRATAPFEAFQFNDIFGTVNSGSTIAQGATLVLSSNVPIFSFVTVIDNQTNDSVFLLPTDDELQP